MVKLVITLFKAERAKQKRQVPLSLQLVDGAPRSFDDPWPMEQYKETDAKLRHFLTSLTEIAPKDMVKLAKQDMGIDLES